MHIPLIIFQVDSNLTLGDCVSAFGIKYIKFLCKESQKEHLADILECINTASAEATTKAVNAFQLLMAGGKVFPQKKQTRYLFVHFISLTRIDPC